MICRVQIVLQWHGENGFAYEIIKGNDGGKAEGTGTIKSVCTNNWSLQIHDKIRLSITKRIHYYI